MSAKNNRFFVVFSVVNKSCSCEILRKEKSFVNLDHHDLNLASQSHPKFARMDLLNINYPCLFPIM